VFAGAIEGGRLTRCHAAAEDLTGVGASRASSSVWRLSEIVEIDPPGVAIGEHGIEYRVRRLVAWKGERGAWVFPEVPSVGLARAFQRNGQWWPEGGDHA